MYKFYVYFSYLNGVKEKTVKTGNNAVEHRSCTADSSSASQQFFRILWNPTFLYCPVLSRMNPIHNPPTCCFTVNFIVILSGTSSLWMQVLFARMVGYIEKPSRNPSPQYLTSSRGWGDNCTQVLESDFSGWSGEGRYNGYPAFPSTCCCLADFDIHLTDDECPSTEWSLFTLSHAPAPHPHTAPWHRVLLVRDNSVPHPYTRPIACYSGYVITKLDDIQWFLLPGDASAPISRLSFLCSRPDIQGVSSSSVPQPRPWPISLATWSIVSLVGT
jgi:hypothetical protein